MIHHADAFTYNVPQYIMSNFHIKDIPREILGSIFITFDGSSQPYAISQYYNSIWKSLIAHYSSADVNTMVYDIISVYKSTITDELRLAHIVQARDASVFYTVLRIRLRKLVAYSERAKLYLDNSWKHDIRLILPYINPFYYFDTAADGQIVRTHIDTIYSEHTLTLCWIMIQNIRSDDVITLSLSRYMRLVRSMHDVASLIDGGWPDGYEYLSGSALALTPV
jgi:hypothetical protein